VIYCDIGLKSLWTLEMICVLNFTGMLLILCIHIWISIWIVPRVAWPG